MIGGAYPNHLMSTQDLGKECTRKTLDNKDELDSIKDTIELVSKIKIVAMSFQNLPKHVSPVAIVLARPHDNNKTSIFIKDMCDVVSLAQKI